MAFVLNIDRGPGEGHERRVYKDILPAEIPDDSAYVKIFNRIAPYMMIGERGADISYELFQITRYIARNRIPGDFVERSEEHTSELQSQSNLVCRLLLEKKNAY